MAFERQSKQRDVRILDGNAQYHLKYRKWKIVRKIASDSAEVTKGFSL